MSPLRIVSNAWFIRNIRSIQELSDLPRHLDSYPQMKDGGIVLLIICKVHCPIRTRISSNRWLRPCQSTVEDNAIRLHCTHATHMKISSCVKVLALFDENIKCQRFSSIYPSRPCNVPQHRGVTVLWQRPIVVRHGKRVKMSSDVSRHHVLFWNFSKYLWLASKSCRTSGSNNLLKNCVTLVVIKKKH